jgi:catalase
VDTAPNQNPHVNYEPSSLNGLTESPKAGKDHEPMYNAPLIRQKISRSGDVDFQQAGARWRQHDEREKTDLINNLTDALSAATTEIQNRMVELFTKCDADYGQRLRQSLDAAAKNPSPATSRYMGRRVANGSAQNGTAVAQPELAEQAK